MAKQLKITQIRSAIRRMDYQRLTLEALGIRGLHKSVVKTSNPALQGMIRSVAHLVKVEEVK